MKRICFLIGFLCPVLISFAQSNKIMATGYVGIGTLNPSNFLHVVGNSFTLPELRLDHYYNNFGASTLQFRKARGTEATPTSIMLNDYMIGIEGWGYTGTDYKRGSYVVSQVSGTPTSLGVPSDLIFATSSGGDDPSEGMRLDKNGNLGIGTATPKEKLSVNGKIRAVEVKVESANWPDYVFTQDYVLPSLQETEKHIKEKGHLSGIPSAAEVEKNGIELGEMDKKLLQKIEELTLYLIEIKKENTDIKNELATQRQEILSLKSNK